MMNQQADSAKDKTGTPRTMYKPEARSPK